MKLLVSTNQIKRDELLKAERLSCDGTWFVGNNTKATAKEWRAGVTKIGKRLFITEDGAIDANWLFGADGYPPPRGVDINFQIALTFLKAKTIRSSMVYHEFPQTTLTPSEVVKANNILGKKIIVLARSWNDDFNFKARVIAACKDPNVFGICFEAQAVIETFKDLKIAEGLEYVLANKRPVYLLLSPGNMNPIPYENRVMQVVNYLKTFSWYKRKRFHIILACYERANSRVKFLGLRNSVEAAIKQVRK